MNNSKIKSPIIGIIVVLLFTLFYVKPAKAYNVYGWDNGGYSINGGFSPCPANTSCIINNGLTMASTLTFITGSTITSTMPVNVLLYPWYFNDGINASAISNFNSANITSETLSGALNLITGSSITSSVSLTLSSGQALTLSSNGTTTIGSTNTTTIQSGQALTLSSGQAMTLSSNVGIGITTDNMIISASTINIYGSLQTTSSIGIYDNITGSLQMGHTVDYDQQTLSSGCATVTLQYPFAGDHYNCTFNYTSWATAIGIPAFTFTTGYFTVCSRNSAGSINTTDVNTFTGSCNGW